MAHVLIMPKQGNTVESCIISEWKVSEGDTVDVDTPVCSVETDKAIFEIPAGAAGTVLKILFTDGDDVPVLKPIMVIGNTNENWKDALPTGSDSNVSQHEPNVLSQESSQGTGIAVEETVNNQASSPCASAPPRDQLDIIPVSPRAKRLAEEEAVDIAELGAGSGPGGRIIEKDIAAFIANRPPLTNAAKEELRKRIAAGLVTDVRNTGTGIGGRVAANDLAAPTTRRGTGVNTAALADEYADTPIRGIRKIITTQMIKSHSTTAPFTLNSSALAVKLLDLRSRFKDSPPELGLNKITINDLILFAVSRTLPRYPYMNVHKLEETIRTWKNVHLGLAVSTSRGLMVPVIRNADRLSLAEISSRAKALADSCRNGSVLPDDLRGSTFTVSNLGNTGIESFTPVINIPEAAILGVCSITPKPAETGSGNYEILPHLGLSLSIDHAVVDGAPAAGFLKELCKAIQEIDIRIMSESITVSRI
jgi:pyruvate dehydrogenase E2 component (dihydrolipoamide acetyltransferase)